MQNITVDRESMKCDYNTSEHKIAHVYGSTITLFWWSLSQCMRAALSPIASPHDGLFIRFPCIHNLCSTGAVRMLILAFVPLGCDLVGFRLVDAYV